MDDLISRQDAIDEFGLSEKTRKYGGDHSGYGTMMLYEIQDTLESLPSAQQWILCSERLPEKSGRYLVTNTRLGAFEVTWNIFYNGKGEAPEGWLYEDGTIAWMPLPEPYKGEES